MIFLPVTSALDGEWGIVSLKGSVPTANIKVGNQPNLLYRNGSLWKREGTFIYSVRNADIRAVNLLHLWCWTPLQKKQGNELTGADRYIVPCSTSIPLVMEVVVTDRILLVNWDPSGTVLIYRTINREQQYLLLPSQLHTQYVV